MATTDSSQLPFRKALAWALFAAVAATTFALATYPQLPPASDAWDYSQEARQLARGEGFTSLYTYPSHLGTDHPPFPVRWRMPLFALLGAGLLKLGVSLPAGFFAIAIAAHALLVGLVFLLATHLLSWKAGAIAAATALASPLLLDPYAAGLSQVPAAALAVAVWLLLLRGRGPITAAAAALIAATAWYLRGESLLFAPIWIWAAWRNGGPGRGATFAILYVAVCAPWLLALHAMTGASAPIHGNPMLLYTREYPGYSSTRTYAENVPGILDYVVRHPAALLWRTLKDAVGYGLDLLWGLGTIAVGFAVAGLLLREAATRWRALAPALPLLVAAALQIAAFSCLERSPRFLVPAVPLVCVALGLAAAPALDRFCGRRMVFAIIALFLFEQTATVAFAAREAARRFPPLPKSLVGELETRLQNAPKGALIWTDVPDWLAWHLDRPALLLPLFRQSEVVAADHPTAAIFLSPAGRARNAADGDQEWVDTIDLGNSIPGWRPAQPLVGGARLYRPAQ